MRRTLPFPEFRHTPAHNVVGTLIRLSNLEGRPLEDAADWVKAMATLAELIAAVQECDAAREQLRQDDRQPVKDRLAKAEAWKAEVLAVCAEFEGAKR